MARRAFVADILVSFTKVRGGLLWLLSAWSMALKSAEHYKMARRAFVAAHCLVSITKVRGGLLWLLSAWSMSLKGAEHYILMCAEVSC